MIDPKMSSCTKKARILCLHGNLQSAKKFREKIGGFRRLLKHEAEFYFVDAPHIVENEDDKRSWGFTRNDSTISSNEISVKFEDSVARVKSVYFQNGPFDGLLGFSQGAALAAILCTMMNSDFHFSFVILVAGYKKIIPLHSHFDNNTINIPSLHIIGESDSVISRELSEELAEKFQPEARQILYHEGGHFVPAKKTRKQTYASFIRKFSNF